MKSMSLTEFRKNASGMFDLVERGETIQVFRHGKAVARIVPVGGRDRKPAWKQPGPRLVIPGASLSRAILEERRFAH